jgi:2-aminoadipate transaminase
MASNDLISFARGAPSADLIPVEAVRKAATAALADDWQTALSYGVGFGHAGLREWLAERHGGLEASQVMITNGSLEAGAMLFRHLVKPGDRVVVEDPSYDRTLLLLQQLGAELVPVPLEDDGISISGLEAALAEGPIRFAHIIPNFHNPAGCTLSAHKREALVKLAEQHDFLIFEDDPYRELPFGEPPPPTMLSLDSNDRVVHASSFSKTVSPGVRMGYLTGPQGLVDELTAVANQNYISPNMLAGSICNELCRSGALDKNIEFVKSELQSRRDAMVSALKREIPEAKFVIPGGGYFLWMELAEGTDTVALMPIAKEEGVTYVAGPDFTTSGGENCLRLSFAPTTPAQAEEGVARLARALARQRG